MNKAFLFLLIGLFVSSDCLAQEKSDTLKVSSITIEGETVPFAWLNEVEITNTRIFKNNAAKKKYYKLKRDVLIVLPYARIAGYHYRFAEIELANASSEKEKRAIIKRLEEEIMGQYEKELKKLTITQGRILIKLIDRETSASSFVLLQQLKSKFTAFFWQSIARLFGHNLKSEYDPDQEDRDIEMIIREADAERLQLSNGEKHIPVQGKSN